MFKKRVFGALVSLSFLTRTVQAAMLPYDYKGDIHVHSNCSHDSKTSFDKIVKSANSANLDFLVITDHKSECYKDKEGWYKNTLILVGQEHSKKYGHYLTMGDLKVIAHPTSKRKPWKASTEDFSAIEVYNLSADYRDDPKLIYFLGLPVLFLAKIPILDGVVNEKNFISTFIRDRPIEAIDLWDKLSEKQKISAVGSVDAHLKQDFPIDIPNQEQLYRVVHTHILSKKAFTKALEHDKTLICEAIKRGNCYISFSEKDLLIFYAKNEGGIASIGESLRFSKGTTLYADTTTNTRIRLYKNGKLLLERRNPLEHRVAEQGIYRVETYETKFRDSLLHISNPIYLEK